MSYTGMFLQIDLSSGKIKKRSLDRNMQKKYLGSRCTAAKILYDNAPSGVDPYDPENPLCFMTGPLTGTPAFGPTGHFATVSPLTNGYMDDAVKGWLPAALKYAGYDGFIVKGKAKGPVYLYVDNESVELKDAKELWGKDCLETEQILKKTLNVQDLHIASIGPAGENLVRFASITAERGRQSCRGGVGTVMGSKNLKAIAVRGAGSLGVADAKAFLKKVQELHEYLKVHAEPLRTYGTLWLVDAVNHQKMLPSRNFRLGEIAHPERINGEYALKHAGKRNAGCFACSILCSNLLKVDAGSGAMIQLEGPEYDPLVLLGPDCGLESFEEIVDLNVLCGRLGVDALSAGGVLSFCMELYEKDLLSKKDLGGLDLGWGNAEAMARLLKWIAKREGVGDVLANGSKKAAETFGKESLKYAMQVKGMEMPAYDPRGATALALACAVSDRGPFSPWSLTKSEEVEGLWDPLNYEGKAGLVAAAGNRRLVIDSLGICEHAGLLPIFSELYASATGFSARSIYNELHETLLEDFVINDEGQGIGVTGNTLTRAFNVGRGFGREDDVLPQRFFQEPLRTQGEDVHGLDPAAFDRMLDEYYGIRGWGRDGVPTRHTLERLGLSEAIEDLY